MENFKMGACVPRKGGVVKEEEFPCTGKLPHRLDQGGTAESWRAGQSGGPRGQNSEKLHFSAHKQLTDPGPDQTTDSGNQEVHRSPEAHNVGPRCQEKCTQTSRCRGLARGADRKAHKSRGAEGGLRVWKETHTSLCDAERRFGELRKTPCKPLPSKHQPAVQGRTRVQKLQQKLKGQVGAWQQ